MPRAGRIEKGALVATLKQPFDLLGQHRVRILVAAVGILLLGAAAIRWPSNSIFPIGALMVGAFILANRATALLSDVRLYEHGLEADMPRSGTAYLPWDAIEWHEIDGRILRYSWPRGSVTMLRDGAYPTTWVVWFFPRAVLIPDPATANWIQAQLAPRVDTL